MLLFFFAQYSECHRREDCPYNQKYWPARKDNPKFTSINHCNSQTSIIIGNDVIPYFATGATQLTSVQLNKEVKVVGAHAFENCTSLTQVKASNQNKVLEVHDYAFAGCTALTSINLTNLQFIGEKAFFNCTHIHSLTLLNANCVIGSHAFDNCIRIISITINSPPQQDSFTNCISLERLKLSKDYSGNFSLSFFPDSQKISSITVVNSNSNFSSRDDGVLFDKNGTEIIAYPPAKFGDGYEIVDKVTHIHEYAFYHCQNIRKIFFRGSELTVGDSAFEGSSIDAIKTQFVDCGVNVFAYCTNLTEIHFSTEPFWNGILRKRMFFDCKNVVLFKHWETVKAIESDVFSELDLDSALTSIKFNTDFDHGFTEINFSLAERAFKGILGLRSVDFSNYSKPIVMAAEMFSGCINLETIILPDVDIVIGGNCFSNTNISNFAFTSKMSLGDYSFADCQFTSLDLNQSFTFGEGIFANNNQLKSVSFQIIAAITNSMFYNCSLLETIEFKDNKCTSIGEKAFAETGLTTADLTNINTISDESFRNCDKLSEIDIGQISAIPKYCFSGCKSLKQISLANVKTIDEYAFSDSGLEKIEIPKNLTSISTCAFLRCYSLSATNSSAEGSFSISNGLLMKDSDTIIYLFNEKLFESVTIEAAIKNIDFNAFLDNIILKNITFNTSHQSLNFSGCTNLEKVVGYSANVSESSFVGCDSLKSFAFSSTHSPATIHSYAFSGCSLLSEFNFNDPNIVGIEEGAFCNCTGLTLLNLTDSNVKTIGKMAFYYCTGISDEVFLGDCVNINESAFQGCSQINSVTMKSVQVIEFAAFANSGISSMKVSSLQTLGDYAFANCSNLRQFSYGSATKSGRHSFENDPIESITTSEDFQEVQEYAFYGLKNLQSISYTDGITRISSFAFYQCTSLVKISISSCNFIGDHAFDGCTSLSTVSNLDEVENISYAAFANCKINTIPSIPKANVQAFAFANCSLSGTIDIPLGFLTCDFITYDITVPESDIPLISQYYPARTDSCVQQILYGNDKISSYKVSKQPSNKIFEVIDDVLMLKNITENETLYEIVAYPPSKTRQLYVQDLIDKLPITEDYATINHIQPYAFYGDSMDIVLPSTWKGSEIDTDAFVGLPSAVLYPDYAYDAETYGYGDAYNGSVTVIMPYDDSGRFVHSSTNGGKTLNKAAIAGGTVGGAFGVAGAVFGGFFLKRKKSGGSGNAIHQGIL